MDIQVKNGCAYITGISDKPIKVPSAMYPLSGKTLLLTAQNTSAFNDGPETEEIRKIFDSTQFEIGRCYTNSERLQTALNTAGIQTKSLVGWLFALGDLPVHHCMTFIDNHILDSTIRPELLISRFPAASQDAIRREMAKNVIVLSQMPHSEVGTFGALSASSFFIGSYCTPEKGREIYIKLMRSYPKHPAANNLDKYGASPLQRMVLSRQ